MLNDCLYCVKQTHRRHYMVIFYANFHIHIPKQQGQVDTTKWRGSSSSQNKHVLRHGHHRLKTDNAIIIIIQSALQLSQFSIKKNR